MFLIGERRVGKKLSVFFFFVFVFVFCCVISPMVGIKCYFFVLCSYYTVAETTRLGPGGELFDFLASCVKDFIQTKGIKRTNDGGRLPLGFTFSFPMTQLGLDKGLLVAWTKSFNCSGVVGEDAAKMLADSLDKVINNADSGCDEDDKLPQVKVVAILNDTTGTLVKARL